MRVALTGGIGSGKSAVAALLAERGAFIVDADLIARETVEPGQPALAEIVEAFGPGVLTPEGSLDRAALAAIVFADGDALARLNAITHPRVAKERERKISAAPAGSVIVEDIPLLVESGAAARGHWDLVVVVDAPDELRLQRLEARGLGREEALARMARQAPRAERLAAADVVIDNSGDRSALSAAVDALWQRISAHPSRG